MRHDDGQIECEGCGEVVPGPAKPPKWYQRTDAATKVEHHACSRRCIDLAAEKSGQTRIIMPW